MFGQSSGSVAPPVVCLLTLPTHRLSLPPTLSRSLPCYLWRKYGGHMFPCLFVAPAAFHHQSWLWLPVPRLFCSRFLQRRHNSQPPAPPSPCPCGGGGGGWCLPLLMFVSKTMVTRWLKATLVRLCGTVRVHANVARQSIGDGTCLLPGGTEREPSARPVIAHSWRSAEIGA